MNAEENWDGPVQDAIREHDRKLGHAPQTPVPSGPVLPVDWFRRMPNGGTVLRAQRRCPPHGSEQMLVTEPERRVLVLVRQGFSISAASRELGKHKGTAQIHARRLRARFDLATLQEVIARAEELGLLEPATPPGRHFWAKVKPSEKTGCWEWQANLNGNGYGRIRVKPRLLMAHRVAYEALVGPIPDGLHIDHLCRNRICVNPDHLEPVSNHENWMRGTAPTVTHARKTHCIRGHEFNEENTEVRVERGRTRPRRRCRPCRALASHSRHVQGNAVLPNAEQETLPQVENPFPPSSSVDEGNTPDGR